MKRKNHNKKTFIEYNMNQTMLPLSFDVFIPENHLVRVVNSAIERMNIEPLLEKYKGGGRSSYHPKMMLKVIVYAYTQRIYSSRRIAKALRENIYFMWLSGNNKPDFRTINRFRSEIMKDVIDEVFASVLELLIEEGYVKLENYFLDGTKIEANANKYSFVWRKATKKYKARLRAKINELLKEIEKTNEEENRLYGDNDLEEMGEGKEIDSKKLEEKIKELEERLEKNSKNKKLKKTIKELKTKCLPRMKKYEQQEEILNGRNSYSKTDTDATFMRMKEDHMKNGQLKPAYNVQIGTENQFVVGYSIHQRPADSRCLIPHLEKVKEVTGKIPENVIADSGYGSEENYDYLEKANTNIYVKYNTFHKEQKKKFKNDIFKVENWPYDKENDEFICPVQRRLIYCKTKEIKTENGYTKQIRYYKCENCDGCELKENCTKAKGDRVIRINFKLREYKQKVKENLCSDKGMKLRSQRAIEAESVFGRIKGNWSFRRFLLRGLEKVKIEWGLLCIAHNLAKLATV
ncbi:transposase [Anoxybacter fermentans]|uniref:Transposase n=1 Tax=Anoxybacter fermentans TaxID=1323375 RepID=A0A3S9SV60_9FIRM|nr:IS1182 family transposase [Anoxybacter fermentans]AZR72140.1 transposase [Anoxybacter fermentans]